MTTEVLESNEKVFKFKFSGVSVGFANAIRRTAIGNVETFAIDKITFYENSSAMFDEYIAHRMGLIPIITPSKGYNNTDEILFKLDVVGPKTVYSKDLETSDKEVNVATENIPIIKLAAEQKLRVDAKAIMGRAQEHAKYQPGLITYDIKGESFEFYVETFGQMPPKEIINKACDKLIEELKDLNKQVSKL